MFLCICNLKTSHTTEEGVSFQKQLKNVTAGKLPGSFKDLCDAAHLISYLRISITRFDRQVL